VPKKIDAFTVQTVQETITDFKHFSKIAKRGTVWISAYIVAGLPIYRQGVYISR